ncbi:hypothetical protein LV478_11660 [Komagataeibacter oboediens]|uniref:hypothetical protein n=1 Tax=Komagataeibacter oboediens TaxID=65958 RepID=UPI0023DA32B9|nr:hypothetical protein [Komagataeibacter oboediens]WEQ51186.1 hypothetical protein LV478_11660 [Komagataeibacter oboediens]
MSIYRFQMSQRADGMDVATFGKLSEGSRNGASCKLARSMVALGLPDQPVELARGERVSLTYPSLHALAKLTFTESAGHPRAMKWVPHPLAGKS